MQLYLKYGSETINFQASGCKVQDGYAPQVPGESDETLVEEFGCWFIGDDAGMRDLLADMERLFRLAEEMKYLEDPYQPVYFYFDVSDTATAWRARVYGGRVRLHEKLDSHYRKGRLKFSVALERDPFWEGAEAQVPLTNTNGTDNTSGLNVYNCNDGSGSSPNDRVNYAKVKAADVEGDMPGPVRLNMGLGGGATEISHLYIGQFVDYFSSGIPTSHLEGEDWTLGTNTVDANSSGGDFKRIALPTTIGILIYDPATFINQFKGRPFRVMIRFGNAPPANTYLKWSIGSNAAIFETPLVKLGSDLFQSLGVVQLPANVDYSGRNMLLYGYNAGGGNLDVDVVYFVATDGYAEMGISTADYLGGGTIYEQWSPRRSYVISTGPLYHMIFDYLAGHGLYLQPGYDQWLHFFFRNHALCDITDYLTVKCYYRPRRRAL